MLTLEELDKGRRWRKLPWKTSHKRPIGAVSRDVKEKVFGQDEHVDRILNFIYASLSRSEQIKNGCDRDSLPQLNSMLLIGPTASGKTHIVRTIAQQMDMVFFPIDGSLLTGEGWKGQSLSSNWINIAQIQKENGNCNVLVFLDEVDKLTIKDDRNSSFSPKFELLKPLDSDVISLNDDKGATYEMDCDRCTFIFAGAFTGIEKFVADRLGNSDAESAVLDPFFVRPDYLAWEEEKLRSMASLEDVESWGFPRELVGRFSFIDVLPPLKIEDLKRIATKDLASRYEMLFPNASVSISDEAVDYIATKSLKQKFGARNLSQQLSTALLAESWAKMSNSSRPMSVVFEVSDGGGLRCRAYPNKGRSASLAKKTATEDEELLQAHAHAQSLKEQIEAESDNFTPGEPLIKVPPRFMKALLLDSRNQFGNYGDAEVLLLHSSLCLIRDWYCEQADSNESLETVLSFCVPCESIDIDPHMQWELDILFQEINTGLQSRTKRTDEGVVSELAESSMVRRAEGDPNYGLWPSRVKGLGPADDEALGTYCDFKAFCFQDQRKALGTLKGRLKLFGTQK